jgi:hypothetical protein
MTKGYLVESWLLLLYIDALMRWRGFSRIHAVVRAEPARPQRNTRVDAQGLSSAIDLACVFYFKQVLCLQRSAALTLLLRRHGWNAEMVIGAQLLPFRSHAWVEIGDLVINDKPYIKNSFQVLERC